MSLREQVYSVLIVSDSQKFNSSLTSALPENKYGPIKVVPGVGACKRELLERSYDIVIINTPLPDDYGSRLAIDLASDIGLGVLIFVKSENFSAVYDQVTEYGVLTVSKPANGQMVLQSMLLLCATRERLRRMEKKTASIEEKMEEIRLTNRAKWALIDNLGMNEAEAHKYIEKQAMDRCMPKKRIAEEIIEKYDRREKQ